MHSLIREFENNIENKNKDNKFQLYFGDINLNSVKVYADKNRLSQVISNLLNNSIKFISEEYEKDHINGIIDIIIEKSNGNDKKDNNILLLV